MNMNTVLRGVAAAATLGMSTLSLAGNITGVTTEPAQAVVGVQVKVTVAGTNEGICGLRLEYGNGDVDVTKMSTGKDEFPRSFMKTYNKAGTYTIVAKGGKEGSTFGCNGDAKATVVVAEAPKPVALVAPAGPAATAAAPSCPDDFVLSKKSVNSKTGAFTCYAKKGAKKPEKILQCPTGTDYFSNSKGTSLGCKKPAAKK